MTSKAEWTRVSSLLPAALLALVQQACARAEPDLPDASVPDAPHVADVQPAPGPAAADARFEVVFSDPMDEGQLIAPSGRSETVVLAAKADVERAAAAIAHAHLSARERALLVPASIDLASDARTLTLTPDAPLPAGPFFLLVSSRLHDAAGRKLAGKGARFGYDIAPGAPSAQLVSPPSGAEAPLNLWRVRASAPEDAGALSLLDEKGAVVAGPLSGPGTVELRLCATAPCAALRPSAHYALALGGAASDAGFDASACALPPLSAQVVLAPRDVSVVAQAALDRSATLTLHIAGAACDAGNCAQASATVNCGSSPCERDGGSCTAKVEAKGLAAGTDYVAQIELDDDVGGRVESEQRFTTMGSLPQALITEVMAAPPDPAPRSAGEYIEIINQGRAPLDVSSLALQGPDGRVRPVMGAPPSVPVLLEVGQRALAVGASFDSRYALPAGTPVLRASTQRLLGHGLPDRATPRIALVLSGGAQPVELSSYPGNGPSCPAGTSLQRDEQAPDPADAGWSCGTPGGTPGAPP